MNLDREELISSAVAGMFGSLVFTAFYIAIGNTGTIAMAIPAILAGSACCAPVILILLGIQITAALLIFMSFLIPLAVVLLLTNLVVSADKVRVDELRKEAED